MQQQQLTAENQSKDQTKGSPVDKTVLVRQKGKSTLAIDYLGPTPTVAQSPRGRVGTTSNSAHTHTPLTSAKVTAADRNGGLTRTATTLHESTPLHLRSGSVRRVVGLCVVASSLSEPSYFFATLSVPPFFPLATQSLPRSTTAEGVGRRLVEGEYSMVSGAAQATVLRWMGCVVVTDAFAVGRGWALY